MENFRPPFFPSTTTGTTTSIPQENHPQFSICEPTSCFPSTTYSPSTTQYYYYPAQYLAPNPGMQFPYAFNYYPYQQAGQPMYPILGGQPNAGLSTEQDSMVRPRRILDALVSKAARNERRMARQRSLSFSRNNTNAAASEAYSPSSSRRHASFQRGDNDGRGMSTSSSGAGADLQNINKHLYTFCTPDNKKLRVLFRKELKMSDVGSLGRIVLPKKEAEENLPMLSDKEGIQLMIRDVYSDQEWGFKYKYWSNNKSRMYLFENAGHFIKQNGVEVGDCIYLYEDECRNLYISIQKMARSEHAEASSSSSPHQQNTTITNPTNQNTVENGNSSSNNTAAANRVSNLQNNANNSAANPSTNTINNRNISTPYIDEAMGEQEETSCLPLFIEEADGSVAMSMDSASSTSRQREEASYNSFINISGHIETSTQPYYTPAAAAGLGPSLPSSSSPSMSRLMRVGDEDQFEDCYRGLGTLPEVDRYKYGDYYSLFDYNRDDDMA